jgi:hypothetical protein
MCGFSRKVGREARVSIAVSLDKARSGGQVGVNGSPWVSEILGEGGEWGGLVGVTFKKESRAEGEGLGEETAKKIESVFSSIEGEGGVVTNFGIGGGNFFGRQIGKVGGKKKGGFGVAIEKIILFPLHLRPFWWGGSGMSGIFPSELEGVGRNIKAEVMVLRLSAGQSERNGSRSCADVDDPTRRLILDELGSEFDEEFGFGPGNEGGRATTKRESGKRGSAGDVLNGFAGGPAPNKGAEVFKLGRGEFAFELEVQTETGQRKGVGNEQFGLKSGRGESVFCEMGSGGFENREQFHAPSPDSSRRRRRSSSARASTRGSILPSITRLRSWEVKPMR